MENGFGLIKSLDNAWAIIERQTEELKKLHAKIKELENGKSD